MVVLAYEPWWYDSWIRHLLFDLDHEVSGVIFWDPDRMGWNIAMNIEEATDEIQDRYSTHHCGIPFHTHPHVCYLAHSTTRGDPSLDDVLLFFRHAVRNNQRNHLIFAKEGMYLLTISCDKIPSPMKLESYRKHLENYPGWKKDGLCDSVCVAARCAGMTRWVREKIPGFCVRFYPYVSTGSVLLGEV